MRSRGDFGAAVEMVGAEKQRRLRRAAEAWLATHPDLGEVEVSFEVVGIDGGHMERLRDAF